MKTKLTVLLLPCIPLHAANLPHRSVELSGKYQSEESHILVSHLGVAVLGAVAGLVVGWAVENRKLIRRP